MEIFEIMRKNYPVLVRRVLVGNLDKTKCSKLFLELNLPDSLSVYVKCNEDGTFKLRGKKEEYRIILPDRAREQLIHENRIKRILNDWLEFSSDVQASCAAGDEWLKNLKGRTKAMSIRLSNEYTRRNITVGEGEHE
jgi:hypothetical protein